MKTDEIRQSWDKLYKNYPQLIRIKEKIACPSCDSTKLLPSSTELPDLNEITFTCIDCENSFTFDEIIKNIYEAEEYISIKDGGESIIWNCPECDNETFISSEGICFACGKEFGDNFCVRCGAKLNPDELIYDRLCSYCNRQREKIMDE